MKRFTCIIIIFFLLLADLNADGKSGAEFLKFETGARPMGMGGAFAGLSDDINALWWNPAGLGTLEFKEFTLMHNEAGEDISHEFSSFIYPLRRIRGSLGGSINYFSVDDIQGYDAGGVQTEKLKNNNLGVNLAYGSHFFEPLYLGLKFGYLRENIDTYTDSTFAVNAGLLWDAPADGLKLGINFMNMGGGLKFIEESSPLPFNIKAGLAYRRNIYGLPVIVTADGNFPEYSTPYYNFGTEMQFFDLLDLRAGYKTDDDLASGLRLGGGIKNNNISVDYAWVPRGDLDNSHRISVSLKWGTKFEETKIESSIRKKFEKGKKYYNSGRLIEAYQIFSNILRVAPRHQEAGEYITEIELKVEDVETSKIIDEALRKGKKYLDNNELVRARTQFETILELDTENQKAKDYLKTIDQRFESVEGAILGSAMESFNKNNYDTAMEEFQRVLTLNPENQKAAEHVKKIEERKKEQRLIQQRIQKEQEERIKKRQITSHMESANNNLKKKNWEQAVQNFQKVLDLDPDHTPAREKLADTLYRQGNKLYKDNELIDSKEKISRALNYNSDLQNARNLLEKIQQKMRDKASDLNRSALSAYSGGDLKQAIKLWEKAVKFNPRLEEAKENLQRARRESQD
ncbi:MAG: PorV/PorQ family protein [Elusimicrobiota bacterium]